MPALTSAGASGYGRQQTFSGYTYYKFTPSGSTTTQVARVYFYTGSNKQSVFSDSTPLAVTVTNPGGSNPAQEGPSNANLAAVPVGSSKWLDFNNGPLVFQFPTRQFFTGYEWYTANDTSSFPERQPTSWTISGSYDNTTYKTLHTANTSSPGYAGITDNSIAYTIRNAWNNA